MKFVAFLVVCIAVSSAWAADIDADLPHHKKKNSAPKYAVKVLPYRGYNHQKVVIVPKGDVRAYGPAPEPVPFKHKRHEHKTIVEAQDVTKPEKRALLLKAAAPSPCAQQGGSCGSPSACNVAGGRIQAGLCPGGVNSICCLRSSPQANPGACLQGYNGQKVADRAKAYQAEYARRHVTYSQPNRQFGFNAKYSDCSSFVTSILDDTGYLCLFRAGRYTAYMNARIKERGGYLQTAKVGDLVMWGGHTGLVTEVCDSTHYTMIAMGDSGAAIAKCKTVAQLKSWGSGGWLGFWTPRP